MRTNNSAIKPIKIDWNPIIAIMAEIEKKGEEKGDIFEIIRRILKNNIIEKLTPINNNPVPPNIYISVYLNKLSEILQ